MKRRSGLQTPLWLACVLMLGMARAGTNESSGMRFHDAYLDGSGAGPEMVAIPLGEFEMGSNEYADEQPPHRVIVRQAFALGKTEVTQGEWRALMGNNPSYFKECGDDCPVEGVNWDDVKEYIRRLNQKTGKQYRLPSEAEWEYACRAGGRDNYCGGNAVAAVAHYDGRKTEAVGRRQANAWGLYDMSGNVWEWVEDRYHDDYRGAPDDGSAWTSDGDPAIRVLRGGSWDYIPWDLRATNRYKDYIANRNGDTGFRLARTLAP